MAAPFFTETRSMKSIALIVMLAVSMPAWSNDEVASLLGCMRANLPATLRMQEVELISYDPAGPTRALKARLYATREMSADGKGEVLSAMMRVSAPKHLAGASYLVRETQDYLRDGMYVYLPSVRRVRRVTGTFADGSLMGTDFSYFDFKQLQNAFGDLIPKHEGSETLGQRSTEVLTFRPRPGVESRYSGVRTWIDTKACVALKAEFMEGDKVRKRLTVPVSAVTQSGGYWIVTSMKMEDLVARTHTELKIREANTAGEVPRSYFDPESFYRDK
jgi:hypothetical protein